MHAPSSIEEAAALLRAYAESGHTVRVRGGGTKLGWAAPHDGAVVDIDTRNLCTIREHNAGDFTAVLDAGLTLAQAQAMFARSGQMLALDPPFASAATIGGILATNDSGPLRHRYGSMRDLVIGITVILSDGTVASSGGRVIKNVAGYDLAKLFTGSYGSLGLVAQVAVRLHPVPVATTTVRAQSDSPEQLAAAARALMRLPLEADCLDVRWQQESGALFVRFAGATARQRAAAAAQRLLPLHADIVTDDAGIWSEQRALQRAPNGLVLKVSGRATDLPAVLRAARTAQGSVVSRAALGLSWISLPADADLAALRRTLAPRACMVLDGADRTSSPYPTLEPGVLELMRRIKQRFDPARVFPAGAFAGDG